MMTVFLVVSLVGDSQDAALPIEDQAMIARAASLDIEQQRYLAYLYARINKPNVARTIGQMVLAQIPSDRQTLLVLASLASEQQQGEEAVRLAEIYLGYYPEDDQGRYFLGTGYFLLKKFSESEQVFAKLKRDQFAGKLFPYETDLASASYSANQWYRAMLSYQELLRHHDLDDKLRSEVRRVVDQIYRDHGPQVNASREAIHLDGGEVNRWRFTHAMHLTERHWWESEFKQDRIKISPLGGLAARSSLREDYATHLKSIWGAESSSLMGFGYGEEGVTSKAELSHDFAPLRRVGVLWKGNDTTRDSLLLESLDGREDKLEFWTSWLIEADLSMSLRASQRDVRVGGRSLGEGATLEMTVDQVLRRNGAHWMVGYRGSYASFDTKSRDLRLIGSAVDTRSSPAERSEIMRNLVAPRINRHGFGIVTADNLTRAWSYRVELGGDYDFVLDDFGYNGSIQWIFRPRKSIEIAARGGYFSSANSSNAGSSAYLLDLSFQMYY